MTHPPPPPDPLFVSSLRECKQILLIWAVFFVWVIGYCALFGYADPEQPIAGDEPVAVVWGIPSWVFWGIMVPWAAAVSVSTWFALTQIEDHPLVDQADRGEVGTDSPETT